MEDYMETDAVPFDMPRGAASHRGAAPARGSVRGRQPSNNVYGTGGLDAAINMLPPEDRAGAQQAVRDADEALRRIGQPPISKGKGPSSKTRHIPSVPGSGMPGGVHVQNFTNCSNVHIGNNNVVTNNFHGDYVKKEEHGKQQQHDADIKRLLGRALGISDGILDNLNHDFHTEGQYEIIYQMIRLWMKKMAPNATVALLVKACIDIRKPDIAREVFLK